MKLLKIAILAAAVAGWTALAWGGTIKLANSKHDLSSGGGSTIKASDTTEICVFCHVPHNAQATTRAPLWNHTLSTSTMTWNPVNTTRNTVLPTSLSGDLQPSAACLGCHDGTVALGDVLNAGPYTVTGTNVTSGKLNSSSNAYIDVGNMEENHPIGVSKPAAKTGFTDFKTVAAGEPVNYDANGKVQCQSCHNPHLYDTIQQPFLKKTLAASGLCVTCHDL
jgi:predicted CXXCH cytochrome family protein